VTPAAPDPQGATLVVHLDGYDGPIDLLLELAWAQTVDLARLSLRALIDQYLAAVDAHREVATLAARSAWLIAASRLVLLKSRLLVQGEDEAAPPEADRLQEDLARAAQRQHARALAHWLEARPQLGRDIFARGQPQTSQRAEGQGDLLDLLLACFDLLAPPAPPELPPHALAAPLDVCTLTEALAQWEAQLRAHPTGGAAAAVPARRSGRGSLPLTAPLHRGHLPGRAGAGPAGAGGPAAVREFRALARQAPSPAQAPPRSARAAVGAYPISAVIGRHGADMMQGVHE
jgi:segregation and condensation protein A